MQLSLTDDEVDVIVNGVVKNNKVPCSDRA